MERFYNEFKNLSPEQQELFKAVMELMNSGNNLNFKTEIAHPEEHSKLELFAKWCSDIDQTDASGYVKFFSRELKEQYVSKDRKGRAELKDILSSAIQTIRERSLGDRVLCK